MKNKNLLIVLACILWTCMQLSCRATREGAKKKTILSGVIKNAKEPNFKLTYDIFSLLKSTQKEMIEIDSNGRFQIELSLNSPINGVLDFGRDPIGGRGVNKYIYTYLEPGDNVHIEADINVISDLDIIQKTLSFSGPGSNNNEFVNQVNWTFESYLQLRQNNQLFIQNLQPDEYKRTVDSIKDTKLQFLEDYADSSKLSLTLMKIYEREFKNLPIIRKINYPSSNKFFNKDKEVTLPSDYYDFIEDVTISSDLEDKGLPYLRYTHFFLTNKYELKKQNGYQDDYFTFLDSELKERAKYIYMAYTLGTDFNAEVYNKFGKNSPYPDITKIVKQKFGHLEKMMPGKPAPQVVFTNMKNEAISSSTFFKGKFIYIDFWATWCKPCIREIPDLVKLEKEYLGKNIEFVSVSFDSKKEPWENYVNREGLTGIQFWVDKPNKDIYDVGFNITMIPRFVLIDDQGNIVNANAPRPSSGEEIRKLLDESLAR